MSEKLFEDKDRQEILEALKRLEDKLTPSEDFGVCTEEQFSSIMNNFTKSMIKWMIITGSFVVLSLSLFVWVYVKYFYL